jgi:hypothetical protein
VFKWPPPTELNGTHSFSIKPCYSPRPAKPMPITTVVKTEAPMPGSKKEIRAEIKPNRPLSSKIPHIRILTPGRHAHNFSASHKLSKISSKLP